MLQLAKEVENCAQKCSNVPTGSVTDQQIILIILLSKIRKKVAGPGLEKRAQMLSACLEVSSSPQNIASQMTLAFFFFSSINCFFFLWIGFIFSDVNTLVCRLDFFLQVPNKLTGQLCDNFLSFPGGSVFAKFSQ